MPSNSENAFDLTSNPCPYTFPDQRDLRNDVIALETTGNVETAQPRRRLTPRKGRSTRPARRTAPATSDPTHDVVKDKKVRKSKILHERTPDEPEEKRAKGVIGCCSICLEEFGSNPLVATRCGHIFCHECIKAALRRRSMCPYCRKKLRGASAYHPVFLS
ncbi:hypothetical protein MSG28_001474 [Choristoneura fumiferana]|uniref:Uncharacterized protein n=1 Tax=Choristoneura fumiferana TaxID=7141 RepID=A0ACC0KUS0_CHOFU|nr:hypothetical protein MSG28_001474 [Choristoneura fumiferana]